MKRCWFGGAMLVILLGSSLLVTWCMERTHAPVAEQLHRAAQSAAESDWQQAAMYAGQAQQNWEKHRRFSAALADHEPMEEIDRLFAELRIWQQTGDSQHYATTCAQLSQAVQAMSDAHALNWWNVL